MLKAVVVRNGAAPQTLREADALWMKTIEDANRAYGQSMHSAWMRYASALKTHHGSKGKKAKSGGTDFDQRYDEDRLNALRLWNLTTTLADKTLKKVQNRIGKVELTDEEPTDE